MTSRTDDALAIGALRLRLAQRELVGPHGEVELAPVLFVLAETLMRRPGMLVDVATLGAVLCAAPECHADRERVKDHMKVLRGAIMVLTRGRVQLTGGPGTGYAVEDRQPGKAWGGG